MTPLPRYLVAVFAVSTAVLSGTSFAQEQSQEPQVLPTRDVDITYADTRVGLPATVERRRWSASEHLQRVDGPDKTATIFDRNRKEFTLLNPTNKTYLILEGSPRMPIAPGHGVALLRGSEAVIASLQCVDWSWTIDNETRAACLTPDGVMLRLIVDGRTILQARSVHYAQQPAEIFQIPRGYQPALSAAGGLER
jgi:hypothetical protein